jgi:hypothetical protein
MSSDIRKNIDAMRKIAEEDDPLAIPDFLKRPPPTPEQRARLQHELKQMDPRTRTFTMPKPKDVKPTEVNRITSDVVVKASRDGTLPEDAHRHAVAIHKIVAGSTMTVADIVEAMQHVIKDTAQPMNRVLAAHLPYLRDGGFVTLIKR